MSSYYIYYKVNPAMETPLLEALQSMQAELRASMPGLAASIHAREDANAAPERTWMEIYHFNGHADHRAWAAFEQAMQAHLARLPEGIVSERHVERFRQLSRACH